MNLGILITSKDTVAADVVASTVMGIDPMSIEYIKLAADENLGCGDLSRIEILGESLDKVIRPFKQIKIDFDKYKDEGIFIYEKGACSGWRHTMEAIISNLERQNKLNLLKGYTLVFGQLAHIPSKLKGKLVNIGLCTKKYKEKGEYIPGCPPHPEDVVSFFKRKNRES